jgi:cytidylate kinase
VTRDRTGPVVAIDGAAGSGKSTLASRLARELDLPYVNTGLMYRAVTARALRRGVDLHDGSALAELAREVRFDLDLTHMPGSLLIEGEPPADDLVASEVEAAVSLVSRHPAVRAVMAGEQRRLGRGGAVMEGRDIGSVIFPDADVKLFLDAAPEERVTRRAREREERAFDPDAVLERDRKDARVNPFVPAKGAVRIDTTGKTPDQVFTEANSIVRQRLGVPKR